MTTAYTENQQQAEAQVAGLARLGKLIEHIRYTDFPDLLDRHIEERRELEMNSALSIEIERTAKIVLCTGGPHCEIRIPENGTPSIVCYGWFGADRFERDLTQAEIVGIESAFGDFETLLEYTN